MSTHHPNRALSQKEMETRRLRAVPYFKKHRSVRRIAETLGVSGPSVHDWKVRWQRGGEKALKAGVYGARPKLSTKEARVVRRKILEGASRHGFSGDFWTLSRITRAIEHWTSIHYEERSVWHLLKRLGFSCQKPTKRALERDEKAIATWLQTTWPEVKRGASRMA